MGKKYMDQTIFDSAVSSVGFLHTKHEIPISELVYELSNGLYKDSIIDDGVWDEIELTAKKYLKGEY